MHSSRSPTFFETSATTLLLLATLVACADEGVAIQNVEDDSLGQEHLVTLWNRSQFELKEVMVAPPAVANAEVLVHAEAMVIEDYFTVADFVSGSHVSFVREKVNGGEEIAVQTTEPVYVDKDGLSLVLFDDAFRLLPPEHAQNEFGELEAAEE